jgi:two-component system response regulator
VLVVEDDADDVELILRVLGESDPRPSVRVARDGKEALDLLPGAGEGDERPLEPGFRLVLLDLKIPRVSGFDVLARIKSDDRLKALPVVVFSSSREQVDVMECYRRGANAYVQKPADFERFREAIRLLKTFWLGLNEPPA